MLARAAAEIIDVELASMVCFLTTCWKDGIIVAVNAPFHKAFGWSTEDLSFCATPGICLSPETVGMRLGMRASCASASSCIAT
jgi:hypothetical protein